MSEIHVAQRICPFCEACCGLEVHLDGERVVAVRGDAADPFSRGYICPKGVALKDLHDDPDRLRKPQLRRGDTFTEIGWDDAFAEIERGLAPFLQAGDRDAFAITLGNPVAHKAGLLLYAGRLARSLGTRNIFSASTLDQMPKQLACAAMFGHWLSIPVPDIARTDLLVVIGANPAASNGSLWTVPDFRGKARALRERGGRLVVIDPRRSETADLADYWLPIRPGGDVFLLLALANVLFADKAVRLRNTEGLVNGLEALAAAVAPYPPERVAARCGVPAEAIRALARDLAQAPRAALYGRIGTCTQSFGTLASWLVDAINILAGHFDRAGGAMFPLAPAFAANAQPAAPRKPLAVGRHRARVSGAPEVYGELPITCLAEEIETPGKGQVRALFTVASNPVLSAPNGPRLAQALAGLDFMVSLDIYRNETTRFANVILPGRSPLEDAHFDVAFPQFAWRNAARWNPPLLPAKDGQPAEWQILLRLAALAGGWPAAALADALATDAAGRAGPERLLADALAAGPYAGLDMAALAAAPHGIDLGELQPRLPGALTTPSGRIELAPPAFIADLARVAAALEAPAAELVIVGRREVRSNNSWMHNLPVLAKGQGAHASRCTLRMHPTDAAARALAEGMSVRIASSVGAVTAPLEISDEMMPAVVSLPHGWGHDDPQARLTVAAAHPGANLNALLDDADRDPLSGNAVLSGVAVSVTPAPACGAA